MVWILQASLQIETVDFAIVSNKLNAPTSSHFRVSRHHSSEVQEARSPGGYFGMSTWERKNSSEVSFHSSEVLFLPYVENFSFSTQKLGNPHVDISLLPKRPAHQSHYQPLYQMVTQRQPYPQKVAPAALERLCYRGDSSFVHIRVALYQYFFIPLTADKAR